MPLVTDEDSLASSNNAHYPGLRRQSQLSDIARTAILSHFISPSSEESRSPDPSEASKDASLMPPPKSVVGRAIGQETKHPDGLKPQAAGHAHPHSHKSLKDATGIALTDTPLSTAPNSPQIQPRRQGSGTSTPAKRATTLDIPGLTKSRASPDGRISERDIGAKLVIIMVGLPARGKSYVTKKMARYLNWLQHDTRVFNVGERRRVAAGQPGHIIHKKQSLDGQLRDSVRRMSISTGALNGIVEQKDLLPPPALAAKILVNGETPSDHSESPIPVNSINGDRNLIKESTLSESPEQHPHENGEHEPDHADLSGIITPDLMPDVSSMGQSADFFSPTNTRAFQIREQVALETLDELLDYVLLQGGSVGILDATNNTLERRKILMKRIRERAGPDLGVLFVESVCQDTHLLEANMRLKLSGPDYKGKDPIKALADFKRRVAQYEKTYKPIGEYEERHNMQYIQMIDVGRKVIAHQIKGFLAAQTVYYLLNFNLSPRQIWVTRHGESIDNVEGKIGGDSELSEKGVKYAHTLTRFIIHQRQVWENRQHEKVLSTHFPPRSGDATPPNPEYMPSRLDRNDSDNDSLESHSGERSFCVWSSMLKRSVQTAQFFSEEEFDIKQMRMLDELNAGTMEGMTYEEIKKNFTEDYELRKRDKLHYRYPGAGGEGYLDIINRLRAVIVEVERMTDHVLLVGHRSIVRVLIAYFKGLKREEVADLDAPLGVVYCLEPKPYGVDFVAYRYNVNTDWFDEDPGYELKPATGHD